MNRRFAAFILAISLFFCVVPALAAEVETEADNVEAESYLDLYVKDGLVALFDGFSVTASDEAITKWDPVDLYGRAGYEDYIDPSSYSADLTLVGTRFEWRAVDGGITPVLVDSSISNWSNYAYLDLSTLGAKLGTVYTVEEIYTHEKEAPKVENGVITNYDAVSVNKGRVSAGWIGPYNFGGCQQTGAKLDGVNNFVNVVVEQMQLGSLSTYGGHFTWIGSNAGTKAYDSLKTPSGANLDGYSVGVGKITLARTVERLGVEVSGTSYTSTIKVQYNITPTPRSGYTVKPGSFSFSSANAEQHYSTTLNLAADHAVSHSIRIYNKALNADEIAQNHLADIVAFFDLEDRLWLPILSLPEEERSEVYASLAVMDFNDSRDTVVSAFEEAFSISADVSYSGYGVAGEKAESLRYYFNVSNATLDVIRESGVSVEVGGLIKMDSVELPTLSSYTHKLVAYGKSGAIDELFVDKDTFAVAVSYTDPAPEDYTTRLSVRAYMKLSYPDGREEITYIDLPKDAPTSLLSAYEALSEGDNPEYLASPETAAYVDRLLGGAIRYNALYLDASAPDGGDGSEGSPYNDFAEAFSAAKSILKNAASPVKLFLLIEEGEYPVYETQTLTGNSEMRKGSHLYVVARGENVVLKTTKDISADDFVLEGDNVYSYQFEKGANGAYPSFRCLYVNDSLATIATNGSDHSYNKENLYITAFDRTYSANSDNAKAVGKMYLPEGVVGDLRHLLAEGRGIAADWADRMNRSDKATVRTAMADDTRYMRYALLPYKIEMHITCQWNYNIVHLAGVDYNDYAMSGGQKHVAVYLDPIEYADFQINQGYSTARRYVHMKNADIYLDEDGEYRYDEINGKLYYYSTEGVEGLDFGYATLDNLLIIRNAQNISFNGISFTGMDDYTLTRLGYKGALGGMGNYMTLYGLNGFQDRCPLYFSNVKGVSVRNCHFYELPCEALDITGWNEDITVDSNTFENIGSAAIRIGTHVGGKRDSSWNEGVIGARNVYVTNNYLYDIANEYYVHALMVCKLDTGSISYNTIKQCTYSAICLGWDWNYDITTQELTGKINANDVDISYNYISDFMTEMADGAAIYMPTRNNNLDITDYYRNRVHHNCVVFSEKTGDGLGGMVVGIYFDASATNWHCYENIILEQSSGATYHGSSRSSSYYVYLQHINTQETYHILVENNFILNVRATSPSSQHSEVYRNYFSVKEATTKRNLKERNTTYINGIVIDDALAERIAEIGADGYRAGASYFIGDNY